MMRYLFFILGISFLFSCSEEKQAENSESSEKQAPKKTEQEMEIRDAAVFINDQLTLAQAQAFVLTDSLLRMGDLDSMKQFIPTVQIEIVAVKHRVIDLNSDLKYSNEFKSSIIHQLNYVEIGLSSEIPRMIEVAESGKQELADQMYFEWVKVYQEKSKVILAAQMRFAKEHNIKVN